MYIVGIIIAVISAIFIYQMNILPLLFMGGNAVISLSAIIIISIVWIRSNPIKVLSGGNTFINHNSSGIAMIEQSKYQSGYPGSRKIQADHKGW